MGEGQLNLKQIQVEAEQFQASISEPREDWRSEIQKIHEAVEKATNWQKIIFRAFGKPKLYRGYHFTDGRKEWATWSAGEIVNRNPEKVEVHFNHATILQFQWVETVEQRKVVHYQVQLRVDEQAFLNDLLPTTIERYDPIYNLIDISIAIPKGELVAESIRMMNGKIEKSITSHWLRFGYWFKNNWGIVPAFIVSSVALYILFGFVGTYFSPMIPKYYDFGDGTKIATGQYTQTCLMLICANFFHIPLAIPFAAGVTYLAYRAFGEH